MTTETYRFQLGDFKCVAINDGDFTISPTKRFFGGATSAELDAAFAKYNIPAHKLDIPVTSLVIDTGEHRVLIDCGTGSRKEFPKSGFLTQGLIDAGIELESITHLIITHGHPDHAWGLADENNNPTFPNARFVMSQKEWDYWAVSANDSQVDRQFRQNLLALKDRFDLVEPDVDIVEGVRLLSTPGHTYHHCSVLITSGDAKLFCPIDIIVQPLHIENPTWVPEWDVDAVTTIASRKRLVEMALADNLLVHGFHFPFPGLGYIQRDGENLVWKPQS